MSGPISIEPGMTDDQVIDLMGSPNLASTKTVPLDSMVGMQAAFHTKIAPGEDYQEWWYTMDGGQQFLVLLAFSKSKWIVSCAFTMPPI